MEEEIAEKAEFIPVKEDEEKAAEEPAKKTRKRGKCCTIFIVVLVIFLILGAFVGGYLVRRHIFPICKKQKQSTSNEEAEKAKLEAFYSHALANVSSAQLGQDIKYFSSVPHVAGSEESHQQAINIKNKFKSYGIDGVELKKYNILLSFPTKPGVVSLLNENGTVLHKSAPYESVLHPTENDSRVTSPYNAFSPSGDVKGKLVYANYGHMDDFMYLMNQGINISGKIVIVRYGNLFRGGKVENAQIFGAKGLIIYSDPADYAKEGINKTYPKYKWLPKDGVQRGNLWMVKGDPLTPGYPATDGIYRETRDEIMPLFPRIPVQPISWTDAEPLLRALTRRKAPKDWQGGLGFEYNIAMDINESRNVSVVVNNELRNQTVYNVIGTIKGKEEPDRYVILGSHHDSWVFGAVDQASGVATLMETARSMGLLLKKGWRPRRTIMFASWSAEEFGIMGSGEWVEEYDKILSTRAVVYINIDNAVSGSHSLAVKSSPMLDMAIFEATKKVESPNNKSETLYDDWKTKRPDDKNKNPSVKTVGGGGDFLFFLMRVGVPCIDLQFTDDEEYPVYHTMHDTVDWLQRFVDPDFLYHRAVTKVVLRLALDIADAKVIPFDLNRFAAALEGYGEVLDQKNNATLSKHSISLKYIIEAIGEFKSAAKEFMEFLESIDKNNPLKLRMANDRLVQLERAFINHKGLPNRAAMKNLIFAPSIFNIYAGSKFAGITDSIHEAKSNPMYDWEQVKKQISMVVHAIRSAVSILKPPAF